MNVIVRYHSRADKSESSVQTFAELRAWKANLAVRPSMIVSDYTRQARMNVAMDSATDETAMTSLVWIMLHRLLVTYCG
jgi:hypothetical protein